MTIQATKSTRSTKPAAAVIDSAKAKFVEAAQTQIKAADEVTAYGKSNMEAVVQAGSIFYKGMEELTKTLVGLTQTHVEASVSAAKALMGAKTLTEFTDLQNAYAKTAFDQAVSESTRLSELAVRITNEAIEPLSARLNATIEKLSKPITFH